MIIEKSPPREDNVDLTDSFSLNSYTIIYIIGLGLQHSLVHILFIPSISYTVYAIVQIQCTNSLQIPKAWLCYKPSIILMLTLSKFGFLWGRYLVYSYTERNDKTVQLHVKRCAVFPLAVHGH